MTEKDAERLSLDELRELVRRLIRENEQLRQENEKLRRLVEELRRQAKRQAAPFSKGKPVADPKKPGRKPGSNYGTKARRKRPPRVDEILDAPLPAACPCCGGKIDHVGVEPQFQAEVPRKPIWRQFNVDIGECRSCHRRVQGRHELQTSQALGAAASQIGPDAQALVVHLNKEVGASYGKITRFFDAAFGISLSRGGAAQIVLRAAERCEESFRQILILVRRSPVVYPDETGWRVAGLLRWLWTFVTQDATAYLIRDSRGGNVVEEALGTDFRGFIGHDGWGGYNNQNCAGHQQCLDHINRRSSGMLEVATRGAVRFPRQVKELIGDALHLRDRRDNREISEHGLAVAIGRLESRLERMLCWTRSNGANERLAKHLHEHRDQLFTFLKHPGIEATNHLAEQAMRPAVVNRKVWGGNRTWAGAHAQEILLSVLRTCVQRGRDSVDFLSRMFRADSRRRRPRLFLPMPAPC